MFVFAAISTGFAIIAWFTAIGLTFMGLADQIVMLAFGLILGSAAIATAIAFGLGGREAAGRVANRWADRITGGSAGPAGRNLGRVGSSCGIYCKTSRMPAPVSRSHCSGVVPVNNW